MEELSIMVSRATLPIQYEFESFAEIPGRMALRLQMMSQSPAAPELLNDLACKCLTL